MCGIAGIYHLQTAKPVDPARLRVMLAAMVHRGAERGEWTAAGVGLGALVDRGAAERTAADGRGEAVLGQPLSSDDDTATIVFDGLLLNSAQLRSELDERGYRSPARGDAELVLAAWRQWGVDCLSHFNGLFAFAIHDHAKGCLFLGRDRMGGRPLHFSFLSDGSLAFASELKGLLRHPLVGREANVTAVEDFLALGYVPDDNCLAAGVRKLAAGHYLLLQRGKAVEAPVCWWRPDFSRRVKASEKQAADYLAYLLRVVVRDYAAVGPSTGLLLSGGMDSAGLAALMAESSQRAIKSLTIGSGQRDRDEHLAARAISHRFAGEHHELAALSASTDILDQMADHFDEPCADLDIPMLMALSRGGSAHFGAALVGHGADEIFAGTRRMMFHHQEERLRENIPDMVRRGLLGPLAHAWPNWDWAPSTARMRARLASLGQSGTQAYARAVARTGPSRRVRVFHDGAVRALGCHIGEGRYWRAMASSNGREPLDRAQFAEWQIALPAQMMTKLDRLSGAGQSQLLAPYMDHRLAEFVASLPAPMRVKKHSGKHVLKLALAKYLPKSVLEQPRIKPEIPVSIWFRGPWAEEARRLASSEVMSRTGWFNMAEISAMVSAHQAGREDHGRLLWQLALLERSLARLLG
jgi:asparagine synthase (glutamine-hydrolysing)